jgi:hypothetical protein
MKEYWQNPKLWNIIKILLEENKFQMSDHNNDECNDEYIN